MSSSSARAFFAFIFAAILVALAFADFLDCMRAWTFWVFLTYFLTTWFAAFFAALFATFAAVFLDLPAALAFIAAFFAAILAAFFTLFAAFLTTALVAAAPKPFNYANALASARALATACLTGPLLRLFNLASWSKTTIEISPFSVSKN